MRNKAERIAGIALAAGATLCVLAARRRLRFGRVDLADPDWPRLASRILCRQGYVFVRLEPHLAKCLFSAANAFFDDVAAKRRAFIPPVEQRATNERTGYMTERGREYVELHPRAANSESCAALLQASSASSAALVAAAQSFSDACYEITHAMLEQLSANADARGTLASILHAEHAASTASGVDASRTFNASMVRIHRYTTDADFPPHCDLGLLTIAPRASLPGLEVQDWTTGEFISVEEGMREDEAILFGGLTLQELTGLTALPHKVRRHGRDRLSAPYFLRASPHIPLPAAANGVADAVANGSRSVADFVSGINEERRQWALSMRTPPLVVPASTQGGATTSVGGDGGPPSSSSSDASTPVVGSFVARPTGVTPSRVRYIFRKLDSNGDGRLTRPDVQEGLARELGPGLAPHVLDAAGAFFDTHAIGDLSFPERYLNGEMFNVLFAQVLFLRHDAGSTGSLNSEQAQEALKFLRRPPADGGAKPDVPIAVPAELYDSDGVLRLPFAWFAALYRAAP